MAKPAATEEGIASVWPVAARLGHLVGHCGHSQKCREFITKNTARSIAPCELPHRHVERKMRYVLLNPRTRASDGRAMYDAGSGFHLVPSCMDVRLRDAGRLSHSHGSDLPQRWSYDGR